MAQVETEEEVGTGVEAMCSQFEVVGPVVEVDCVPVVVGPGVEARGPVVALTGVTAAEALSLVTVNVSAVEVRGPAHDLASSLLETDSVGEVRRSVVESVFFAVLSVASVIHEGPVGLVDCKSEVTVIVAESRGPVVKAADAVLDI